MTTAEIDAACLDIGHEIVAAAIGHDAPRALRACIAARRLLIDHCVALVVRRVLPADVVEMAAHAYAQGDAVLAIDVCRRVIIYGTPDRTPGDLP